MGEWHSPINCIRSVVEFNQLLTRLHPLSLCAVYGSHRGLTWRANGQLHLHGFEHDERVAELDAITRTNLNAHDGRRHRRTERILIAIGRARARRMPVQPELNRIAVNPNPDDVARSNGRHRTPHGEGNVGSDGAAGLEGLAMIRSFDRPSVIPALADDKDTLEALKAHTIAFHCCGPDFVAARQIKCFAGFIHHAMGPRVCQGSGPATERIPIVPPDPRAAIRAAAAAAAWSVPAGG